MKIVIFAIESREAEAFDALKHGHALVLTDKPLRADNAAQYAYAEIVSIFIYSKLGREVLEKLAALKLIATHSTGYDHVDVAFCAERGILVSNVPTYGEITVAEHVFALLLAISHRPRALIQGLRSGKLAAAGFDVLPDEPLICEEAELISSIYANQQDIRNLVGDHVLLNMPNVVVTPHSAFNTREAIQRIVMTTVSNIGSFLTGRPANLVAQRSEKAA